MVYRRTRPALAGFLAFLALAAMPTLAHGNAFMKITGDKAAAENESHDKWIEVEGWSWGDLGSGSGHSRSADPPPKPDIQDVMIHKTFDESSTDLMKYCAEGHRPDDAVIVLRKSHDKAETYLDIRLESVTLSGCSFSSSADDEPIETYSFTFRKIDWGYTGFARRQGKPPPRGWDPEKKEPITERLPTGGQASTTTVQVTALNNRTVINPRPVGTVQSVRVLALDGTEKAPDEAGVEVSEDEDKVAVDAPADTDIAGIVLFGSEGILEILRPVSYPAGGPVFTGPGEEPFIPRPGDFSRPGDSGSAAPRRAGSGDTEDYRPAGRTPKPTAAGSETRYLGGDPDRPVITGRAASPADPATGPTSPGGTPAPESLRPQDGLVDVPGGQLNETFDTPPGLIDLSAAPAAHSFCINDRCDAEILVLRSDAVAVRADGVQLSGQDMHVSLHNPAGDSVSSAVPSWGYNVYLAEPVTRTNTWVPIYVQATGLAAAETLTLQFEPQTGQTIEPLRVVIVGDQAVSPVPVAQFMTEAVGEQMFDVSAVREGDMHVVEENDRP